MKQILIAYATREGQTERIAEYLRRRFQEEGLKCDLLNTSAIPHGFSPSAYSASILCASVHMGSYEAEMVRFVNQNLPDLQQMFTAFIAVSLAQAGVERAESSPDERQKSREEVDKPIVEFQAKTGWHPSVIKPVAGALAYREYDFLTRLVMKRIAKQTSSPTDTSRDYEFTDWSDLNSLVQEIAARFRDTAQPPLTTTGQNSPTVVPSAEAAAEAVPPPQSSSAAHPASR